MKTLVVGGTGVLGRHLVPLLLARGHEVLVLSPGRRADSLPPAAGHVTVSLLEPRAATVLDRLLPDYDAAVNVATAIPHDPSQPDAWKANTLVRVQGTRTLVDAVRRAGVPRLVQMSITMAYQDGGDGWLDESAPFDPALERAAVVAPIRALEATVRQIPPARTRWTLLRGARFVGPGTVQDQQRADLRAGRLPVTGDGRRFVSLVNVRDFAAAVVAATEAGLPGAVLNISDEPIRVADYLDRLALLCGAPPPRRAPDEAPDLPSQRVLAESARQLLGWRPEHGIWPTDQAPISLPGRRG
ncbi:NAD-dependent epimerase/dehydratase family protein [Phytohabitans sp. LJ34]|uniref:NAD-dependent epimerase/dehydratase family protein n=1 Tax=Phytohabitans sp. LJ34 TaxID=3452217 RepID=UPI003F8BC544